MHYYIFPFSYYIILFSEISKEKQHRASGYSEVDDQAQIYSEIDCDPYDDVEDGDSIDIETNPAYKPIDELPLSQNRSRQAQVPLSLVIVNESVGVSATPMDGEGVEEEQRAESRVEEEEADVTYYTPMNTGEVKEGGMSVQSRAVLKETEHDSMGMAEGALLQAFQGLG